VSIFTKALKVFIAHTMRWTDGGGTGLMEVAVSQISKSIKEFLTPSVGRFFLLSFSGVLNSIGNCSAVGDI